MIYIFYTQFNTRLCNAAFNHYLKKLSPVFQTKILKYRQWQDAQRCLLGKTLLVNGLDILGQNKYSLTDLKYSNFDRPYFDELIDFNISHSGEYVICAISLTGKVGVDVEEIRPLEFDDFKEYFSVNEWSEIEQSGDYNSFYRHWTQKEAFFKAIGRGLNVPLKDVEILDNKISWENKVWYLQELKFDRKYIAHLSTNLSWPELIIEKINYN